MVDDNDDGQSENTKYDLLMNFITTYKNEIINRFNESIQIDVSTK